MRTSQTGTQDNPDTVRWRDSERCGGAKTKHHKAKQREKREREKREREREREMAKELERKTKRGRVKV